MANTFEYISANSPKVQTSIPSGFNAQNSAKLADVLTPGKGSNGGNIDIINNYPWSLTPSSSLALKETPYIKLTEFYLLDSAINQLFKTYGLAINTAADLTAAVGTVYGVPNSTSNNLYEGMYDHTNPTGFVYTFPYFSNVRTSIGNTWTEKNMYDEILNKQAFFLGKAAAGTALAIEGYLAVASAGLLAIPEAILGSKVAGYFSNFAESLYKTAAEIAQYDVGLNSPVARAPGEDPALDVPKLWSTTNPQSFNISFPLFNILQSSNILANWELCYLLSYQNLYNKRNLFTGIPPVFYQIEIPGVYFSKAGYVSKLSIKNVGNIHNVQLNINGQATNVNVPDAYHIDMIVTDFFIPSKNFLDAVSSPSKVTSLLKPASNLQTPTAIEEASLRNTGTYSPTGPLAGYGTLNSPASLQ
jgi:hypothetical protein